MSSVSFVKIHDSTERSIKEGISKSLDLIGYSFSKKNATIVIKPNLCYYWDYTTGQTTDPRFVAALIDLIREKISPSADISIVESDASAMKCKYAFRILGYEQLSKDRGVRLVNLTEDPCEFVQIRACGQSFRFMMPRAVRQADLKINTPKIKYTVEKLGITCALKNIFGCNPFQKKSLYHRRIDETIVALNKAMGFDLCIVDGTVVSGVQPRWLGLLMASTDPVAVDAVAARIAGLNPVRIRYLNLASREGLGTLNFASYGERLEYFIERYPCKSLKNKLRKRTNDLLAFTGMNKKIGL